MNWTLSLTILLPTSSFPILSQFQQSNAISYLIHTKGHDIPGNASLLKEMRAFPNVSNQGSWLKFNVVALNIEYREETISNSMLSRPEPVAHYRQTQVLFGLLWTFCINLISHMTCEQEAQFSQLSNLHLNIKTVDMIAGGGKKTQHIFCCVFSYWDKSLFPSESEHSFSYSPPTSVSPDSSRKRHFQLL